MSPPTRVPELAERRADSTTRAHEQHRGASAPGSRPRAAESVVLDAQRAAGNRAVGALMTRTPGGIQRAPNDDDPRRTSGIAHGPTLDSARGVATAPTLPGTDRGDRRRSGMAHGATLDSSSGVATNPTLPGTDRGDPRGSGMAYGQTLDTSGGAGTAPTIPGGGSPAPAGGPGAPSPDDPGGEIGPAGTPLKGPATLAGAPSISGARGGTQGGGPARPAPRPLGPTPGLTDNSIADAHRRNPALIHRAVNFTWYDWMLTQQKFQGDEFPRGIRVGNAVVVAPDYDGPGPPPRTDPIVEPDEDGKLGPNDPIPGDPKLYHGPYQQKPDLSDPNAKRAIFPGSRRGPEPGMKRAEPVSHEEVLRAYRNNPGAVHPSSDDHWHDQVWNIDRGQGQSPRAYRSGSQIIIDSSYPLDGRHPDASPRGSVKQAGPGWDLGTVLNPVKIPTDPKRKAEMLKDPVEGPRLRDAINAQNERARATHMGDAKRAAAALAEARKPAPEATPAPAPDPTQAAQTISPTGYVPQEKKPAKWDVKDGTISRETTTEEQRVNAGGSTDTKSRSSRKSYSLTKGAGQEWKQREETQTGEKLTARERSTKLNAGLGGLALNRGSSTETGTTPDGPRAKTEKNMGLTAGPGGVGGTASAAHTTAGGTKAEGKGDLKLGPDGIELTGTGSITTARGFTGHLSVSGKSNVVAGDPKPLPNGKFEVEFVKTDQNGVDLGGGWSKPGGGGSIGFQAGSSTSASQYETRVFDTKAEAVMFQLTAAVQVSSESDSIEKSTTADGALALKEGEVRGSSQTDTDTIGASAGMSQVSVGVASTTATTTGLKIEKMAGNKVRVTPSVAEREALNASINVAGTFGNTKGGSETNSFAVTYEFDLGTDGGKKAFEQYCKQRLPPPMPPHARWIDSTTGHQIEDHDTYKFAHVGEIGWGSHATQQTVVDEEGTHTTAVGGQSEKVELNAIRKLTFDKNRHAEANIMAKMDNGQISRISGQLTVGGEDGSFNREQFRKIFSDKGAPAGTSVTSSGEWTLSADIDKKVFEELAQLNEDMRRAKTNEERVKIYSELAQKGGAQMLGGQVRSSGKKLAWNLELKGDPNFPGAAGRAQLNLKRARLAAQLKDKPDTAGSIAADAKDSLDALKKRLTAVSDKTKYTDLPDELRDAQRDLINTHIAEFKSLRSQALSVHMRGGRKEDLTDVLKRAADEHGYDDVKMEDRAWRKAQDLVTIHETEISVLAGEIAGTRNVVQRMFDGAGAVRWGKGVHAKVYGTYNERAKEEFAKFKSMAPRLTQATVEMRNLKEQWSAEPDPKTRENLLRQYDGFLLSTIQIMDVQLNALREAAKYAYVVTSEGIVQNAAFAKVWERVKADPIARSNATAGLDDDGSVVE